MGDIVFNIAKGRLVELHHRVDSNDPATSGLVLVILKASGLESDALLKDYATLADVLAGASDEATNVGYARKVLTDADITDFVTDTANDRNDIDMPDQTWTGVAATGGAWGKALVCYDPDTTGGTDATIIPMAAGDFAITPDGTDIVLQVAAAGYGRAS